MRPENRVWGFSWNGRGLPLGNRRQRRELRRNLQPTLTFFTPGIPQWPSRDPIGERGGANLYGFVGNDGLNKTDYFGLSATDNSTKWNGDKDCKVLSDNGKKRWRIADTFWSANFSNDFALRLGLANDIINSINGSKDMESVSKDYISGVKGAAKALASDPSKSNSNPNVVMARGIGGVFKGAGTMLATKALFLGYNEARKAAVTAAFDKLDEINKSLMEKNGAVLITVFKKETCVCKERTFWFDSIYWESNPDVRIQVYYPPDGGVTTNPDEDSGDSIRKVSDPGGSRPFSQIDDDMEAEGLGLATEKFLSKNY